MFNKELLHKTLSFQAESYDRIAQNDIAMFVIDNVPYDLTVQWDDSGVYITKGYADLYPAVIAHLDQVHMTHDDFKVYEHGDIFFAFASGQQVGVGGDDKCGVYLCLQALLDYDAVKVVLFFDEEVGCVGSKKCIKSFFNDVSFVIQGDRRGDTTDFITHTNGITTCTDKVKNTIKSIISKYGYEFKHGILTDVGEVVRRTNTCGANISVGYYHAHTDDEVVVISEVEAAYNLMRDVFDALSNKKWTITNKEMNSYTSRNNYNGWFRPSVNVKSNHCKECNHGQLVDYGDWLHCSNCWSYSSKNELFI